MNLPSADKVTFKKVQMSMVKSHELDSLLKLTFSKPNGPFTCYTMYL